MLKRLKEIKLQALEEIMQVKNMEKLEELRVKYLGKKGEITAVLKGMGQLSHEKRPLVGQEANELRALLEERFRELREKFALAQQEKELLREKIDVTLLGKRIPLGSKHPLTLVAEEIKTVFMSMGFDVEEGPEVELDYYNFEALNLPQNHPARDMQDSFYITENILLRTHTSPVQARAMERRAPKIPVRFIAPGRVYRKDDVDASHSPMFHQVEGMVIDKGITFADMKGIISYFNRQIFGEERKVRFRPSFFPFTEPSAEVDVSCNICGGAGCRLCKGSGWLEIMGCGMVHPRVLEMSGYNPEEVSGFAFGLGIERIALLKYDIDDMRLLFENDVRFLEQFK
jgi:phenylalanyl-tRNA synthetase alpha chain